MRQVTALRVGVDRVDRRDVAGRTVDEENRGRELVLEIRGDRAATSPLIFRFCPLITVPCMA